MVFVVLFQQICKLSNFLALFTASKHFNSIDLETNNLVLLAILLPWRSREVRLALASFIAELLPAELIVAFHPSALSFVRQHFLNRTSHTAYTASYLILRVYLHYYFGRLPHEAIVATRALVAVSLATAGAE